MKILLLTVLLLVSSMSTAEAPPFIGCNNLGCIGKFGSIYVRSGGDVAIRKPDTANGNSLECSLEGGNYFVLKRSHPSFNEIYSLILTGQAAQKNIYIRAVQNSSDCEVYYAVIYP